MVKIIDQVGQIIYRNNQFLFKACMVRFEKGWPLVNLLVQILDSLDGGTDFNVEMALELVQQLWVVGNNPNDYLAYHLCA